MEVIVNNEIAYQYINNKNYYITKSGILYSVYVKGAHGKTDINQIRKVSYGQDRDGYYRVVLSDNGNKKYIKVHQIVVNQFFGGCPEGYVVNHIDGNKHNNSVDNLEIITSLENTQHAWKIGLNKKELNPNRILVNIYDHAIDKLYRFESLAEASKFTENLSITYINRIRNNELSFNLCLFKKVVTGEKNTDYYVECYYNGLLYKTFANNEEAGKEFNKDKSTISSAYKSIYPKKINRYTITFPNVSTIENIA